MNKSGLYVITLECSSLREPADAYRSVEACFGNAQASLSTLEKFDATSFY